MTLNGLLCADVLLTTYSLTHSLTYASKCADGYFSYKNYQVVMNPYTGGATHYWTTHSMTCVYAPPLLHEIFCADPLRSWLGPPLAALRYVMYFRFYG